MPILYPSNLTDNRLNTLPNSEQTWVVTHWEAEATTAGGFILDTPYLTEVNKAYELWLGTLSDDGLAFSNTSYQEMAATCERHQVEEGNLWLDGRKFFQDNDTHPYRDFTDHLQMSSVSSACPTFEKPPFHRHYTQFNWNLTGILGTLPQEVIRLIMSSAVGKEGCHLHWISEKAGVDWMWMDFTNSESDGESDREVMTETTPCWYDNRTHGKCPVNPYE